MAGTKNIVKKKKKAARNLRFLKKTVTPEP
jgi:hypothetical protein